LLTNNKELCSY